MRRTTALESSPESTPAPQGSGGDGAGDDDAALAWIRPLNLNAARVHPLGVRSSTVRAPPAHDSAFSDATSDAKLAPHANRVVGEVVEAAVGAILLVPLLPPGEALVIPAGPAEGVDPVVSVGDSMSFTPLVPRPDSVCTSVTHGCPSDMIDLDLTAEGSVKPSGSSSLHSMAMCPFSLCFRDSAIETL